MNKIALPRGSKETLWDRRRRLVSLEIEQIALAEFAAHGYENVTIEQIATAAGLTVRTFYRYFANKEDVVFAMSRRVAERMIEIVRGRPADEGVLSSFRAAVLSDDASPEDEKIGLQWHEIFRRSGQLPSRALHSSVLEASSALIAERLRVDQHLDIRPRLVAALIATAIEAGLERWFATGGVEDRRKLIIEAFDVLESIGSVVPPAPRAKSGPARIRS